MNACLVDDCERTTHARGWCVRWCFGIAPDALVADHVDFDTTNNSPANLVPSCTGCNTSRSRA